MATDLQAFHQFLGEKLQNGAGQLTPEQALEDFRAYQRELRDLREKLRVAKEQSARGESQPFDAEALKRRVRDRLAKVGIRD